MRSGTVRAVVYSTSVQYTVHTDLARLVSQCGARRLPVSTRYNSYRLIQRQRRFKTNHYEELSENGFLDSKIKVMSGERRDE